MANPRDTRAEFLLARLGVRHVFPPQVELFDRPDALPLDLCAQLVALVDEGRRPSIDGDENGDEDFRTSETCDLSAEHRAVCELEERLFALNRIDPARGSRSHTDCFEPEGGTSRSSARWRGGGPEPSCMIVLDEAEASGPTRFRAIQKTFQGGGRQAGVPEQPPTRWRPEPLHARPPDEGARGR